MGRIKKKPMKPWCWYCNREFDDENVLVYHQKTKHFKCHVCQKRLFSGPGLVTHCMQVHKETVEKVPNALPNRDSIELEIYGMGGIPEEDKKERERKKNPKARDSDGDDGDSGVNKQQPTTAKPPRAPFPGLFPGMAPPVLPGAMMAGMMPPFYPPFMGMPPMMPVPPAMHPYMPRPTNVMPPHPAAAAAQVAAPVAAAPLFPSAEATSSMLFPSAASSIQSTAAENLNSSFSEVYSPQTSENVPQNENPGEVVHDRTSVSVVKVPFTNTETSRLIHPEEDLSLEELRARMPKYMGLTNTSSKGPSPSAPTTISQPPKQYYAPPVVYSAGPLIAPPSGHYVPPFMPPMPPHRGPYGSGF